jgi:hypothetical protein
MLLKLLRQGGMHLSQARSFGAPLVVLNDRGEIPGTRRGCVGRLPQSEYSLACRLLWRPLRGATITHSMAGVVAACAAAIAFAPPLTHALAAFFRVLRRTTYRDVVTRR